MTKHPLIIPDRMIALSLLPPPAAGQSPVPFGFGALVVEQTRRGEARFELHAHGFGANYRPEALRERLQPLFTPDTMTLILDPNCEHRPVVGLDRNSNPDGDQMVENVPKSGYRTRVRVSVPNHLLRHAAAMASVRLPSRNSSPLARIRQLGIEAQAAWICYLFSQRASTERGRLLASFEAWRCLQKAKRPVIA
tara:strand:- start:120 stop:701 length:582 start_codon:yes stop_codon:yes gene_type:complete